MATYQLGIFAIFGGFMIGVLLHDEADFVAAWKERVGRFVNVFFLPIFFTYTGLRTDIGSLDDAPAWGWCVLLIALATLGKFGGCYVAARAAGLEPQRVAHHRRDDEHARADGADRHQRRLRPRRDRPEMFTMLVLMAIFSTVITSPLLRRWLPRLEASARPRPAQREGLRRPFNPR